MVLHNYVENYQQRLGIESGKKLTKTEKILACVQKKAERTAEDIIIDYTEYKKAKQLLHDQMMKPSDMRDNFKKRGMSKKLLERIPLYEVSMRAINEELQKNKKKRKEMLSVFGLPDKSRKRNRHQDNHI